MDTDVAVFSLITGLCKAAPEEFLNPSTPSVEVTIRFPARAFIGFEEVASKLETIGLLDEDHGKWLERTINFLCALGIKFAIDNYIAEVANGLADKRETPQKETEGAREEGHPSVQGAHETEGSDRED